MTTYTHYLPVIAAFLALISPIIYAKAIFQGRAKPHRTTRLVMFIICLLSVASLFAQGNWPALWLAGASLIQAAFILILSLKRGLGGRAPSDFICLFLAVIGIALWQLTKQPVVALYFAVFADFCGMLPAIAKTYKRPETEIWSFFAIDTVAGVLTVVALGQKDTQALLYPLYIVFINAFMVFLILWRGKRS